MFFTSYISSIYRFINVYYSTSLKIVQDATQISPFEVPELVHSEILRYLARPYRKLDFFTFGNKKGSIF
jgi:hypothetical protein